MGGRRKRGKANGCAALSDSCPMGTLRASIAWVRGLNHCHCPPPPPPEECQLFNMEAAVTKLEVMFQKAESDLDYIQHKLEFEVKKSLPDDSSGEENPLTLLKELSMMKSRYKSLCAQLEQVAVEQKESMNCIRATLNNTMKMVQQLEQQADLELSPLTKEEQTAVQQLQSHSPGQTSGGADLHKTTLM
uniref:Protein FAM33A n=1 Tax=Phascolarctos cinereus TaxID=38626 RepID=A0A6P5KUQ4_PHACI|nr:spindle and kinetochore-associated protein 2 [Phascolarctos cinereus]